MQGFFRHCFPCHETVAGDSHVSVVRTGERKVMGTCQSRHFNRNNTHTHTHTHTQNALSTAITYIRRAFMEYPSLRGSVNVATLEAFPAVMTEFVALWAVKLCSVMLGYQP
jgi:hypothetical protein